MKKASRKKKYNRGTGGYKIDLYRRSVTRNGTEYWRYLYSTDMYKLCKDAKASHLRANPGLTEKDVAAYFDKT